MENGFESIGLDIAFVFRGLVVGEFTLVHLLSELGDAILKFLIGVVVGDLLDLLGRENVEDWFRGAVEGKGRARVA